METRNKFVEENLKLVWKEVHKQISSSSPIEKDDAFQEGALAMILALDRFDPSKDVKKSTYSTNFVRGYIQMMHRNISPVHIPLRVVTKAKEIDQLRLHHLSVPELAKTLNVSYETAYAALAYSLQGKGNNEQLFVSLSEDNEDYYAPSTQFENDLILSDIIQESMQCLTDREQQIIRKIYLEGCSTAEVAELVNRTQSRVRQIMNEALRKMKKKIGGELSDYITK